MNLHPRQARRHAQGFSLVEMMVAITVGLVLITVMSVVYLNSKSSTRRQDQLSIIQQSVRTAFEYLSFDSRMLGHLGCFTRLETLVAVGGTPNLANNFAVGIEGYEFASTAPNDAYTLTSSTPTDTLTASSWTNSPGATTAAIPLPEISGGAAIGITPGSDVLIVRSISVGKPVRLTAPVAGGSTTAIPIENRSTGTCPNGTANVAGFCDGSFGVISSCSAAQAFQIIDTGGVNLNLPTPVQGSAIYAVNGSEVFPMQTVVYYIKRSSSGTTTSLYRRVLDGAQADPTLQDQELIEGVENMQIRYGVDTDAEMDGIINGDYLTANNVGDWSRVLAVRISLLVRAPTSIESNLAALSAPVNGVTVTFPTTGPRFDRRVFTTTVALRNRIAYAAP